MTATMIEASRIITDGGTQPRAFVDVTVVQDYTAQMQGGAKFPPLVVFYDGAKHWLADGFHRFHATADGLGAAEVECDVRQGTQRDAILYSVGANACHGMRRTNQDKRRAVMRLLEDTEWKSWSDREIAEQCSVGRDLVGELRRGVTGGNDSERTYTTKHGTVATMQTARIGRVTDRGDYDDREPVEVQVREYSQPISPFPPAPSLRHRGMALAAEADALIGWLTTDRGVDAITERLLKFRSDLRQFAECLQ